MKDQHMSVCFYTKSWCIFTQDAIIIIIVMLYI